jgi:3-hydroxyisobutyrate dehydrogenase
LRSGAYAKKAGLDQATVLQSIGAGAAGSWSLNNLGPRIIDANFEPGFFVKHFIKDMKIAAASATELGLPHDGLRLALAKYEELAAAGGENKGTQALYTLIDK